MIVDPGCYVQSITHDASNAISLCLSNMNPTNINSLGTQFTLTIAAYIPRHSWSCQCSSSTFSQDLRALASEDLVMRPLGYVLQCQVTNARELPGKYVRRRRIGEIVRHAFITSHTYMQVCKIRNYVLRRTYYDLSSAAIPISARHLGMVLIYLVATSHLNTL